MPILFKHVICNIKQQSQKLYNFLKNMHHFHTFMIRKIFDLLRQNVGNHTQLHLFDIRSSHPHIRLLFDNKHKTGTLVHLIL